jgi:Spy/CpxP family protein refolding chaperone
MKTPLRILVVAASLAVAAPLYAQGGGGGGGGGMQQMTPEQRLARTKEQLLKDITLAPAVAAKVDTVLMTAMTKQTAARGAGGGDRAAMMEAMAKLNTERNDAIKALLTDERRRSSKTSRPCLRSRRGGF